MPKDQPTHVTIGHHLHRGVQRTVFVPLGIVRFDFIASEKVLLLFPESGMAYHDRGGAKIELNDFSGAVEDLTAAIKHDEGNNQFGDSYMLRARALRGLGEGAGRRGCSCRG